MNDYDRLKRMLEGTKEDAPVSCSMFREFLDNHFAHLKQDVAINRRLSLLILGAIIASAVAVLFKG